MERVETLQSFYQEKLGRYPGQASTSFNLFSYKDCLEGATQYYRRRDFYKVTLANGKYIIHYGDQSVEVNGPALAFFSPAIPYTIEMPEEGFKGDYFIFTETYFNEFFRRKITDLPLFSQEGKPIFLLDPSQENWVREMFSKMATQLLEDYPFKHDLIRSYISELIHFALKQKPGGTEVQKINANTRLTHVFKDLLESQFPIETTNQRFDLRSPADFAKQLSVHVNHLNRALKESTGSTTSQLIADRLASEAISLLKHSDWNIAQISWGLGFEDPAHFNHFFKKQTRRTPSDFRV